MEKRMTAEESERGVESLQILSVNRLADKLKIPKERLASLAAARDQTYCPFMLAEPARPFQKLASPKLRPIDNPLRELKWVQKRIYRRLLRPICFPQHILGAVRKRSVVDNASRHLSAHLLVTLDIRQCFPSITNVHVYRVWAELLGCSPPVAKLLTELTTFRRHLPQGAATSPLLANLFIWMIDEPIRRICKQLSVAYSTWIDDLAFSGDRARELIQPAISVLAAHGLHVKRTKIKIMGPNAIKVLTGTRLGSQQVRAPKDKLSRIRSGIHKLRSGLVEKRGEERFILGLVGQLRFIDQVCPGDVTVHARELREASHGRPVDRHSKKFLAAAAL
jgi:RNA-directed DNA polymerase